MAFQMADVIVLDRTLRPHVFDGQEWKYTTAQNLVAP
jgi:hypothetical protein